ncbi:hypothetical protein [Malikia sp.]|nr:hypothetical protein [Malikia sp.]MDD2729962.1 hypothetical protein [Malikia sp.]
MNHVHRIGYMMEAADEKQAANKKFPLERMFAGMIKTRIGIRKPP